MNLRTLGTMAYDVIDSPLGAITLVADDSGLRHILFPEERHPTRRDPDWRRAPAELAFASTQLREYFAGERTVFDLPMAPLGTDFQRQVWFALADIPHGQTISYAELARRLGRPTATRAVGAANGRNPLPIVLPCHRVIGADGRLTGFGGGLPAKHWLLVHEGAHPTRDLFGEGAELH